MNNYIVGIGGRSGSGKSTLVKKLLQDLGPDIVTLHTMDNYYLPREQQFEDDHHYKNFDLPTSFYRDDFYTDLCKLKEGKEVQIKEYQFNNSDNAKDLITPPAPIILVEGLFVFYYPEVHELMNLKVFVDISFDEAYRRRLRRDQLERNYSESEINYRYMNHVEPSFLKYIHPHVPEMHVIVQNEIDMSQDLERLKQQLLDHIK